MVRVGRWRKVKPEDYLFAEAPGDDRLKTIRTVEPESIKAFTADGKWEEIKFAVDSGATESVHAVS